MSTKLKYTKKTNMGTTQIIIFVIAALLYLYTEFNSEDIKHAEDKALLCIRIVVVGFIFLMAILGVLEMNRLNSKNPCPQYEKLIMYINLNHESIFSYHKRYY